MIFGILQYLANKIRNAKLRPTSELNLLGFIYKTHVININSMSDGNGASSSTAANGGRISEFSLSFLAGQLASNIRRIGTQNGQIKNE